MVRSVEAAKMRGAGSSIPKPRVSRRLEPDASARAVSAIAPSGSMTPVVTIPAVRRHNTPQAGARAALIGRRARPAPWTRGVVGMTRTPLSPIRQLRCFGVTSLSRAHVEHELRGAVGP